MSSLDASVDQKIEMPAQWHQPAAQHRALPLLTFSARQISFLVMAGIVGTAIAVGGGSLLSPEYKASAQLYLDPRDLKVLDNQITPQTDVQNIGTTLVETQALVLRSDNLLREVTAKLNLTEDPEFNGTPRTWLARMMGELSAALAPSRAPDTAEDRIATTVEKLQQSIDVYLIDRSYVIEASAKAEERGKAQAILDALVAAFLEYQTESRAELAARTSQELDEGLDGLRRNAEVLEREVARYKADNRLIGARGEIVSEQQLADLNTRLVEARVEAARLKARLEAVPTNAAALGDLPEAVSSQTLQELRGLLARVSQQRALLATRLGASHPDMISISDSERELKAGVEAELARIRNSLAIAHKGAKDNETALTAMLETLRGQLREANTAQVQLRELQQQLDTARAVYQQASTRASEAREQAKLNTANIRVISDVNALRNRVFPPPLLLLAAAGFVGGLFLAYVFMYLRPLIRVGRQEAWPVKG